MTAVLEIKEQVPVSAACALTPGGISDPGFPDAAKPLHQISALRVFLPGPPAKLGLLVCRGREIGLNPAQHVQRGRTGQPVQPGGKRNRFDVYHSVGYTTM